jgi:outer membrane protein OmpA-like peptidoglycan-associated protein
MRHALSAFLLIAAASSAAAQTDDDVTVNPPPGSAQVLIDPGTGQARVVPPLLMPGENEAPIKLHMPRRHRAGETPSVATAPPPRVTHVARAPAATQPTPSVSSTPLSDLTDLATAPPPKPAAAVRKPTRSVAAVPPPVEQSPQRTASVEPPRKVTPHSAMGQARDVIIFSANASDPTATAISDIKSLAGQLNAALSDSETHIQLMAYGGPRGEKSSDTRRLSLKRALVVRQLLIDDGIPSERIEVHALGGVDDDGPPDRVDVYVKG